MKIAVIGAGISGLTAAYYLSRAHDVDLFERNGYAGGHTRTVPVRSGGADLGLDTGFMVYNEASYPGFSSLLRELGVQTQPSDMSFGVRCSSCRVEYSSRGLAGMLARPSNAVRPGMLRLGFDILRFYRDAGRSMTDPALATTTLVQYLKLRRFSEVFRRHFIVPLLAAVWSTPPSMVDTFPAQYFLRFIHNHGLVGGRAFRWRTIRGGSSRYVEAMLCRSRIRSFTEAPVRSVRRGLDSAEVTVEGCRQHEYDSVVLACHADEALQMLEDPGQEETNALRSFTYVPNRVVLHRDSSFLPARKAARASWNYTTRDCREPMQPLSLTYHLNRLQGLDTDEDFCVTVNPDREPPAASVLHEAEFSHPRYTFRTLEGQQLLRRINGERRTFFAGAYLGYGFHEDGYAAGREVAAMLGAVE